MPSGLPGVQRQHQPTLWKLWSLRLLPHRDGLLQRLVHLPEFGSEQLRRLRVRLPRIDPYMYRGGMLRLPAMDQLRLGQPKLRRVWRRVPRGVWLLIWRLREPLS
jgi:hypothetical protein